MSLTDLPSDPDLAASDSTEHFIIMFTERCYLRWTRLAELLLGEGLDGGRIRQIREGLLSGKRLPDRRACGHGPVPLETERSAVRALLAWTDLPRAGADA